MPNAQTHGSTHDDRQDMKAELDAEERDEDEDEIEPEFEALFGLAQMDAEAAVAYEIVAQYVTAQLVHEQLLEFAGDHRRHVDEIGGYLAEQGVEAAVAMPEPESSSFATLANAMSGISGRAGLRALQAAELFTNETYSAALELALDAEARALVERNLADEQRHARWLSEQQSTGWDSEDVEEGSAKS